MAPDVRSGPLYHGGAPGLRAGDLIVPQRVEDGATAHLVDGCPVCEARRRGEQLADDQNDPAHVYVTTDREYAAIYANGYPHGGLYRVTVDDDVALTPTGGDDPVPSWHVPVARVAAVLDPLVRFDAARMRRAVRRYLLRERS